MIKTFCALIVLLVRLTGFCNASTAKTLNVADPISFFTTVADKTLRSTFSFGITNIPVQSNGVFVYSPAVQRLLQLTANVYDATTTNFYPTVFRPVFNRGSSGDVIITGYQQVVSVSGVDDPQLAQPIEVAALPFGTGSNMNIYGVPWIIGAKRGFPNFNQFVMRNDVAVTRKLQVMRSKVEAYQASTRDDFRTNEMFVMSITNRVGYSFWNSYSSNYAGGDLHIFIKDIIGMSLTNEALNRSLTGVFATNIFISAAASWPGSRWDLTVLPDTREAAPESFVYGSFDFAFLPQSAYQFSPPAFIPTSLNPQFETNIGLIEFSPLGLMTTNWLRAFILDGSNVIDYVQFKSLISSRCLKTEIQDPNSTGGGAFYYMWSTNRTLTGVNWGAQNQIAVSETAQHVPSGGRWIIPPNLPPGLPPTITAVAAYFSGFFSSIFLYNGVIYTNTNLVMQAPYTPTRTAYEYTAWEANDPLVHYLSSDLSAATGETGLHRSDDAVNQPLPFPSQSAIADRYQPWGRDELMFGLNNVDKNVFNVAYRDPLVWSSDDWNFPNGSGLPLTTLGRIHRGTPWQTVFLKATNILDYSDSAIPANGLATWTNWTGNADVSDAILTAPTHDWRLAQLLMSLFSTNDPTQLQSVNDTNTADLLNVLSEIAVQTNSSADVNFDIAPQFDSFVMSRHSPQALAVANAIQQTKANQPNQRFNFLGDILATPELALISPWLNTSDENQLDYGISEEAYEAIPSQLLLRLRPDSFGSIIKTSGGWSVQFSGSEAFDYILETSTNLVNWEILSTNIPAKGVFNSPALPSSNSPALFYRSVLLP